MSNPSSNRWREGRPQSLNAPPQQQKQQQQRQPPQPVQAQADRAKASASPRPSSHGRIPSSSAPQNRGPQSTSQAGNAGNTWVGPGDKNRAAATTAATPVEEKKMKGPAVAFNGEEVRAFLRRDAPTEGAEPKKSGTTSTKPGVMANGQDFWMQLRKQITELEQSKR